MLDLRVIVGRTSLRSSRASQQLRLFFKATPAPFWRRPHLLGTAPPPFGLYILLGVAASCPPPPFSLTARLGARPASAFFHWLTWIGGIADQRQSSWKRLGEGVATDRLHWRPWPELRALVRRMLTPFEKAFANGRSPFRACPASKVNDGLVEKNQTNLVCVGIRSRDRVRSGSSLICYCFKARCFTPQ